MTAIAKLGRVVNMYIVPNIFYAKLYIIPKIISNFAREIVIMPTDAFLRLKSTNII